jgi:coenzyme F420-reducing hydrogenase beta subunit
MYYSISSPNLVVCAFFYSKIKQSTPQKRRMTMNNRFEMTCADGTEISVELMTTPGFEGCNPLGCHLCQHVKPECFPDFDTTDIII